jgi:predicted lipoprotein
MKSTLLHLGMATLLLAAASSFSACKDDNSVNNEDTAAATIASQFVDNTVSPTYQALAAKTEQLAQQIAALKLNPNDAGLRSACETFLAAREEWEKSEAFLFGAAGDFGIDPHIDSWPLDENAFNTLMNSPSMLHDLDNEDGDVVAGERLGNALLGFHALEFILFADGQPKPINAISSD